LPDVSPVAIFAVGMGGAGEGGGAAAETRCGPSPSPSFLRRRAGRSPAGRAAVRTGGVRPRNRPRGPLFA